MVSASTAPVLLVGGWLVAGALQPPGYSPARQTISVLAGHSAHDRWLMTLVFFLIGCCHLVTAAGLYGVRPEARALLVVAGLSGFALAVFAEPVHGSTTAHLAAATVATAALSLWPVTVARVQTSEPLLSVPGSMAALVVFLGLVVWLLAETNGGAALGSAERVLTGVETLWPAVVVLALRRQSVRAARMVG